MTIVRTITATCDATDCSASLDIDPHTSQVFHRLTDAGWSADLSRDPLTFCPDHGATA